MSAVAKTKSGLTWYVVRCVAGMELQAAEEIAGLGQVLYLPRFRKEFKHARHKGWSVKYLSVMTGYLFVMASENWARLESCDYVSTVLRVAENKPFPVADAVVQEIRRQQEAGEYDQLRVHGRVDAGSKLKMLEGALAGRWGEVTGSTDQQVVMLLEMFGRQIKATAPVEILGRKE